MVLNRNKGRKNHNHVKKQSNKRTSKRSTELQSRPRQPKQSECLHADGNTKTSVMTSENLKDELSRVGRIGDLLRTSRTLGTGASATVKLASNIETGEKSAVKILDLSNQAENDKVLELFRKEVQVMKELNHPNIVKLLESSDSTVYKENGKLEHHVAYIAQEAVLGGELHDYVGISGVFDEPTCRYYFTQLL